MKKLIITGAANGIGRATLIKAIEQGYFVIAADKDAEGLRVLQNQYGADVLETQVADFSDNAVIKGFIPALYERHSTIYGLVNNAGLYHGRRQKLSATPDLSGTVLPYVLFRTQR